MAGVQFQCAITPAGERPVVRHQNQRTAGAAIQLEQQVGDFLTGGGIQIARRFIGKQHCRMRDEGASDRHTLLLSAGELFRIVRNARGQTHLSQHLRGCRSRIRTAGEFQWQHDVLNRGQGRDEMKRLKHEAHVPAANRRAAILVQRIEIVAGKHHASRGWRVEARQQSEQRRLPGAGRSDDRQGLTRMDGYTDISEDRECPFGTGYGLGNALRLEDDGVLHLGGLVNRLVCIFVVFAGLSARSVAAAPAPPRTILVFGDSISAGYGIRVEQGWVSLLQRKLESQGYGYRVVNASVSGETTAGGSARLPRALAVQKPGIVVLELGGNDGLRALPLAQMRANLLHMVDLSQRAGAKVLVVGMRMPPNYGPDYTSKFHAVYDEVSKYYRVPLVPFLLNDVALNGNLMQADGIHPNVEGQPKLLETLWPQLKTMLVKQAAALTRRPP